MNEEKKEYCDIVFARLFANDPLFNVSSVDLVIGKFGLINLLPPIIRSVLYRIAGHSNVKNDTNVQSSNINQRRDN